jgi:hypothetical protein
MIEEKISRETNKYGSKSTEIGKDIATANRKILTSDVGRFLIILGRVK